MRQGTEFGTKRSNRLLRGDSGDRGVRGGSVASQGWQRSVSKAESVKREEEQSVNEDGKTGGSTDGGFGADLRLAETEQSLLVPEVDSDSSAPQIGLKDLLW